MGNDDALTSLVHDIKAKCANLKSAAAMLRGEASKEEHELLRLMSRQARSLADEISAYQARRLGERLK
ncbi:MAG TPA: hypothetical protein DCZ01_03810 [Elusimicrobia bacterium]|nr:MAG: hypothetical protein A2X37_06225 [Elusimicrobia bacterium GWA2_66_18]HAZ07653.1 hypothetical protein [Elusimicrobiota bacterium]